MDIESGQMMKHRQLITDTHKLIRKKWTHSLANKFGRLFQGVCNQIKSPTNTCYFIHEHDVPTDCFKDVRCGKFECSVRTQKVDEPYRTRLVLGGNRINCDFDVGTPTADMLVVKILLNSVIIAPGAKFMTFDISDFYLNTTLTCWEYVKLNLRDIPDEITNEHNLKQKEVNGFIYVEVRKEIYGLPQSNLLSNKLLQQNLAPFGYRQSTLVPGLWKHDWRPIQFTLVVDNFDAPRGKISNQGRLEKLKIHWHHARLELHTTPGPLIHARIQRKGANTI